MADSPEKNSDGVIKLTVFSEGKKLDESIKIVDILVRKAINVVPSARLTILMEICQKKTFR